MAKSKSRKPAAKRPASKPKPKPAAPRRPSTPAPSRAATQINVKEIKGRYDRTIRSPKRELKGLRKEIAQVNQQVYNLNRKIKQAPSKYYAAKLRKQKRELEEFLKPHVDSLKAQRTDFVQLEKGYERLRKEKQSVRNKLTALEKKITQAEETKNWKELEKLTYQKINLEGQIDNISGLLGAKIDKENITGYEPEEEADKAGYSEDPNNPYTIWQAIAKFEEDRASKKWDYFVINGKRISAENEILLATEAADFWSSLKVAGTGTPYVLRYFKLEKKTVKYTSFKP